MLKSHRIVIASALAASLSALAGCGEDAVAKVDATTPQESLETFILAACAGDKEAVTHQMEMPQLITPASFEPALERSKADCERNGGIESFEYTRTYEDRRGDFTLDIAYHFGNGKVSRSHRFSVTPRDGVYKVESTDPQMCHYDGCFD